MTGENASELILHQVIWHKSLLYILELNLQLKTMVQYRPTTGFDPEKMKERQGWRAVPQGVIEVSEEMIRIFQNARQTHSQDFEACETELKKELKFEVDTFFFEWTIPQR